MTTRTTRTLILAAALSFSAFFGTACATSGTVEIAPPSTVELTEFEAPTPLEDNTPAPVEVLDAPADPFARCSADPACDPAALPR